MQSKMKIAVVLLLGIATTACNKNSDETKARLLVEEAGRLVCAEQYNTAKIKLDSVHLLYPKQVASRRAAKQLSDSIVYLEALKTAHYSDSLLQITTPKVDSLTKLFKYEKNDRYEDYGKFTHCLLKTDNNIDRCFLQTQVNENLQLMLKSFYVGPKAISHTIVKLSAGENHQQAQGSLHQFNTGANYEILTIENAQAESLLQFVDAFRNERMKVELINDKQKTAYTYYLIPNEKKALADTYQLFVSMRDLKQLEQQNNTAQRQISYFLQKKKQ